MGEPSNESEEIRCPLCGSAARYVFTTEDRLHPIPGKFDSYRCPACRVIFLYPFPTEEVLNRHYPEETYYAYQATENKAEGLKGYLKKQALDRFSLTGRLLRRLARLRGNEVWELAASFPAGSAVLDIGCGSGEYLAIFQKFGFACCGIERSQKAATIASQRGFKVARDWQSFPGEKFDIILLRHTLEHLPDPRGTLITCFDFLRENGRLVISVPSFSCLSFFLFGSNYWQIDAPRHFFGFSRPGLRALTEKIGWKVEKEWTVTLPAAFAFSIEHWLSSRFSGRKRFYAGSMPPKLWHKLLGLFLVLPFWAVDAVNGGESLVLVLRPNKTPA